MIVNLSCERGRKAENYSTECRRREGKFGSAAERRKLNLSVVRRWK